MNYMKILILFCIISCVLSYTNSNNCKGQVNNHQTYEGPKTLLRSVKNGKLYESGSDDIAPKLLIANVYGSAYERGYAYGELLKDEIRSNLLAFLDYVYNMVGSYLKKLPKWIQIIIERDGIDAALEMTFILTKPYIPTRFTQQAQGMADALGSPWKADDLMRIALFPELIQAACSMGGFYGKSISNTSGTLYQLRALDWGTDTPLQKFPLLLVHHPQANDGNSFATLTWAGLIGTITGFSSSSIAVCEKVWISYKGKQNRAGMPWHFMMRDILQYDTSIEDAIRRVYTTERTCSIWLGVGSGKEKNFNALHYSYEQLDVFNSSNMTQPHVQFDDLVYVDKHVQPSSDPCMSDLIKQYYGNLDATTIYRYITSQFQTGDMHIAVFDHAEQLMYISNAAPYVNGSAVPAYDRPFIRVNMTQLFNEPNQIN